MTTGHSCSIGLSGCNPCHCGFTNTETQSLSVTEVPVDPDRASIDTLTGTIVGFVGAAVLAGVVTQWGSGVAVQRSMLVVALSRCSGDDVLDAPLDLGTSPLQLVLGTGSGRYARGAVVGNIVLCLAAVTVGCLVVAVKWRQLRVASKTSGPTVAAAVAATSMPCRMFPLVAALLPRRRVRALLRGRWGRNVVLGFVACWAVLSQQRGCAGCCACVRLTSAPACACAGGG